MFKPAGVACTARGTGPCGRSGRGCIAAAATSVGRWARSMDGRLLDRETLAPFDEGSRAGIPAAVARGTSWCTRPGAPCIVAVASNSVGSRLLGGRLLDGETSTPFDKGSREFNSACTARGTEASGRSGAACIADGPPVDPTALEERLLDGGLLDGGALRSFDEKSWGNTSVAVVHNVGETAPCGAAESKRRRFRDSTSWAP